LTASSPHGARALAPCKDYGDGRFEADLKLTGGSDTGLFLRYQDTKDFVLASLARDRSGKVLALLRQKLNGRDRTLGSAPVPGGGNGWHRLAVEGIGHTFGLRVDGKPCLQARCAAAERGAVGLEVQGSGAFRDWSFMPVGSGEDVNDTPTPSFAGIIDRNSWAGRAGAWEPDPSALDTFWHTGYFPRDVEFRLGVYRSSAPATTAKVALSPKGALDAAYLLTARHDWSQPSVNLELTRKGRKVASGVASLPSGAGKYCLSVRREGGLYSARVNDRDGLVFQDATPLAADSLGLQVLGGLVHPNDTRVASPDLRNHIFDAAPTDWFITSGTWETTSRWPCTPGWAWFSGVSAKEALIHTKARFEGDQEVQFYAGAKELPEGEAMRDTIVGLCGSDDPARGYRFTIQAKSGGTYLAKDGNVVARAEGFSLSQAAIHFDWTGFAARKEGNELSLRWWGRMILEYKDPTPLDGGHVWLGTFDNGIAIPRATIYGRQE
jgi:hypothetical protein